jgi:hypothetical protein
MAWILSEEWLWVIIIVLIAILVGPLLIIWLVIALPAELKLVATLFIIIGWGIASGYKDWLVAARREEEKKRRSSEG